LLPWFSNKLTLANGYILIVDFTFHFLLAVGHFGDIVIPGYLVAYAPVQADWNYR